MHPASVRPAHHHAGLPIEADPLEVRPAVLTPSGYLTDPYFVADHLYWLPALDEAPIEHNN